MTSRTRQRPPPQPGGKPRQHPLDPFQLQLLRRDYRWRRVLFRWTFSGRSGDLRRDEADEAGAPTGRAG